MWVAETIAATSAPVGVAPVVGSTMVGGGGGCSMEAKTHSRVTGEGGGAELVPVAARGRRRRLKFQSRANEKGNTGGL
jgi:hypothetical protein